MKLGSPRLLKIACVLSLVSSALIAWGILVPLPIPVIFAMSMGQGLGTVAVGLFAIVVLRDLKPRMLAKPTTPTDEASVAKEEPQASPDP